MALGPVARALVRALTVILGVAIAVAGCGGGHRRSGGTPRRTQLTLTARLLRPGAFPGFHAINLPKVIRNAQTWESDLGPVTFPARQAARLKRLGFLAGTYETLVGQDRSSAEVTSLVEQFGSAAGARGALDQFRARLNPSLANAGLRLASFAVNGIPRASGIKIAGPLMVRQEVGFVDGPFYYQVAASEPRGDRTAPSRRALIKACRALYRRV